MAHPHYHQMARHLSQGSRGSQDSGYFSVRSHQEECLRSPGPTPFADDGEMENPLEHLVANPDTRYQESGATPRWDLPQADDSLSDFDRAYDYIGPDTDPDLDQIFIKTEHIRHDYPEYYNSDHFRYTAELGLGDGYDRTGRGADDDSHVFDLKHEYSDPIAQDHSKYPDSHPFDDTGAGYGMPVGVGPNQANIQMPYSGYIATPPTQTMNKQSLEATTAASVARNPATSRQRQQYPYEMPSKRKRSSRLAGQERASSEIATSSAVHQSYQAMPSINEQPPERAAELIAPTALTTGQSILSSSVSPLGTRASPEITTPSSSAPKFPCLVPNCPKEFNRAGDLDRHHKMVHCKDTTTPMFCDYIKCPRRT